MSHDQEGKAKLRIVFLSYVELPRSPNSAAYQRLVYLGRAFDLVFLTTSWAHVPAGVEARCQVRRVRVPRSGRWADLGHLVGLAIFAVWAFVTVLGLRLRGRVDLVYTFHNPSLIVGGVLAGAGVPWVADMLDMPHLNAADEQYLAGRGRLYFPRARRLALSLIRGLVRRADLVITTALGPDVGFARILRSEFGVKGERLLTVPNGVDLGLVTASPPAPDSNALKIFYVGFVSPRRGVDTLIEAFARAQEVAPDRTFEMVLVGPAKPEDLSWLRGAQQRLDAGERLRYLGEQVHEKVVELMAWSDVCVYPFPRRLELDGVLPIKVVEYLASGRPVVATDLDGVSGIVENGRSGILTPAGDPSAMAEALVLLAREPGLRIRMSEEAVHRAASFEWRQILETIGRRLMTQFASGEPVE